MPFDTQTRNRLARLVTDARELIAAEFAQQLQSVYGIAPSGEVTPTADLNHLDEEQRTLAELLRDRVEYLKASSGEEKDPSVAAVDRLTREQAFTVLNRLAALRMAENRGFILESVARGYQSKGFQVYSQVAGSGLGDTFHRYRRYLFCLFDELAVDLGSLFDRRSPSGLLFPRETAMLALFQLINATEIEPVWAEDETIGWIYQYYNDESERRRMREQSTAPRNSRELAVRNQFFTPRYVVEFLVDNTLGLLWYETCKSQTALKDLCHYLVRRPSEVFLAEKEAAQTSTRGEELPERSVYIPYRRKKDPRDLKLLDPACGSGHFLLYSFDLLETIYEEAWLDEQQVASTVSGRNIRVDYPDLHELRRAVPELIVRHNLCGIDIDLRACQIAALALWLRAQRSYQRQGLKPEDRPNITRSNIVCSEQMPGDRELLEQFVDRLQPTVLGQLVQIVFEKMKLAGEGGPLLKIENEIAGAIAEAKRLWLAAPKAEQSRLFAEDKRPEQGQLGLDLSGIEDDTFWERVEEQIYRALQAYAEEAEHGHGYQRRLFADDAGRGFAFIDLCRKRFDVVLMNPPFGAASIAWKSSFEEAYPRTKNDMYAAFIERGLDLLATNGLLGAITSRTGFFLTSFQKWRDILLREARPSLFADLGHGVLDSAMVETAAYCIRRSSCGETLFMRLIGVEDKRAALADCLGSIRDGHIVPHVFSVDPIAFGQVPEKPFAYWATPEKLAAFTRFKGLEEHGFQVRKGLDTNDNFRFFRLCWEVPLDVSTYVPLAKGGEFAKYHSDVHLSIDWKGSGELLKESIRAVGDHPSRNVRSEDKYFLPALTWSQRTTSGLSVRLLSKGSIFTTKGPGITGNEDKLPSLLGVMNSAVFESLISLLLAAADSAARSYDIGVVQRTPVPSLDGPDGLRLGECALSCVALKRKRESSSELSHFFVLPALLMNNRGTLAERMAEWQRHDAEMDIQLSDLQNEIDTVALRMYGIKPSEDSASSANLQDQAVRGGDTDEEESGSVADDPAAAGTLVSQLMSYLLGCAYGRWDVRYVLGERRAVFPKEPFAALPVCSPGMLQNEGGLPFTEAESREQRAAKNSDYPIDVPWDGILVDDPENKKDVIGHVRTVLNIVCKDEAEAIELEACELLGVRDLREYFRKPSLFFADHLRRYSKSRRQAPLFWPLSTASGSYTLWLYYPRLTAQTLHQCIADFLGPKLKNVSTEIQMLRSSNGSQSRLGDLLELQDELKDMQGEIERVIKLPYVPNLNDGALITAAPLWKLFRMPKWQKDLRNCWGEFEGGDHDWAHLALSIWPVRVKEKCESDRSIAVAHNLSHLCEVEQPKSKVKKSRAKQEILINESAN